MNESPTVLVLVLLFVVAILGGITAAIAGFGIGSLLTPVVAASADMSVALAVVAIPHAVATAVRCWRLRRSVDWRVVRSFGVLSAAGGLAGAALYTRLSGSTLTIVLGALLLATAVAGLSGWAARLTPGRSASGSLGIASGFFGGIAGNQGGLRAAALMLYKLTPAAFVATSTATGLMVDAARLPFYLTASWQQLAHFVVPISVMTAGVYAGTLVGERALFGMSPNRFRVVVSVLIGLLGVWLLIK